MAYLSVFKRRQIIAGRMAGASVIKTADLFGVPNSTVSNVMTAIEKERKIFSLKKSFRRKRKPFDGNRWALKWLVRKDH